MAKGEFYRSAFTKAQLIAQDTALIAGQAVRLGAYQVQAGETIMLGFGPQSGQDDAQGRIFFDARDNGTAPGNQIEGTVRLLVHSPQDRPLMILGEWRTEQLRTNANVRNEQVPFPEGNVVITEDKKIVLEFIADSAGTLGKTNTKLVMDITRGVA